MRIFLPPSLALLPLSFSCPFFIQHQGRGGQQPLGLLAGVPCGPTPAVVSSHLSAALFICSSPCLCMQGTEGTRCLKATCPFLDPPPIPPCKRLFSFLRASKRIQVVLLLPGGDEVIRHLMRPTRREAVLLVRRPRFCCGILKQLICN